MCEFESLSTRTKHCLIWSGINSKQELVDRLNNGEEFQIRNMGLQSVIEIEELTGIKLETKQKATGLFWKKANLPKGKGYWIHDTIISPINNMAISLPSCQCSECDVYVEQPSNFCPNCGADMRGGSDVHTL